MSDMGNTSPTKAYDLLDTIERDVVDDYVQYVKNEQHFKRQRIALALNNPIPAEYVRRSKGVLNKPLVRVAIQEKIMALSKDEDLSPDRVIDEHASIAFSNLLDIVEPAEFGEFRVKNLSDIPKEVMAAVKTIRTVPTAYGNRIEVIMHDKLQSLKIMGELMGLVVPDQPPVLRNYASPEEERKELEKVPADEYQQLLENQLA